MVASVPKPLCFLLSPKSGGCHPPSQNDYGAVTAANSWSRPQRQARKNAWTSRLIISSSNAWVYSFLYLSLENIYEGRAPPIPGVTFPASGIIHFGWPLFLSKALTTFSPTTKTASFNPAIICTEFLVFLKLHFSGNEKRARGEIWHTVNFLLNHIFNILRGILLL